MKLKMHDLLTDRLAMSPFWKRVGWSLESAEAGRVRVRLPYSEANTTAATALHGGVIAATLDVAGSLAAWSAEQPVEDVRGRTLGCDVSYIAGALGEDVFGEAEVLRRGREIVFSSVRAVNGEGKLLASGNHIYHFAPPHDVPAAPDEENVAASAPGRTMSGIAQLAAADSQRVLKNLELLNNLDGRMPYMAQLGWEFCGGAFGLAEFVLPCKGHAIGDDGGIAGGALLTAVDHAGSLAAWMTSELGNRGLFGSTVNTKLHTFAPAIARDVIVKARAVGGSGTLINAEVNIQTRNGEPVAAGSTVYRIVKRERG
ncbi:MAG: hotdog fold thioesterase [Gammaproteobacteria bacterium]|nr:hotdog fold thioesterase [Gammaproteobacteria bacterium]